MAAQVETRIGESEAVSDMLKAAKDVQKQLHSAGVDAARTWSLQPSAGNPGGLRPPESQFWRFQGRAAAPNAEAVELAVMFQRMPAVHKLREWQAKDTENLKAGILQQVQDIHTQVCSSSSQ